MPAPGPILELVERFQNNREAYRSGQYNETQLRREFIDPFFISLGWDVNNERGYAEPYKDVIHEDAIKVGGATKAPDYCFRIGGARKFFLETKRPAVNIKEDIPPAYQLRRYGWSAKLPISILTDFEEFAVYDCRTRPSKTDKASTARIIFLNCSEYGGRWDEIAAVFAREAVMKGSFDRFVESKKVKKGTAEVDAAFLAEIESWRDLLARNLASRHLPDQLLRLCRQGAARRDGRARQRYVVATQALSRGQDRPRVRQRRTLSSAKSTRPTARLTFSSTNSTVLQTTRCESSRNPPPDEGSQVPRS